LEDVQPLLVVIVAEQFFHEGFHDELEQEEKMALVECIGGEGDQKLEEILSIQFQARFASSGDRECEC
jgi:hypothetical protein